MEDEHEVTPGGSEVLRHQPREEPPPITKDAPVLDAVQAHVEGHVGPVDKVFHELVSPYVHLDVLQVAPAEQRPYWTLVTCGMSAEPMSVPDELDEPRHIELVLALPAGWQLDDDALEDERWYWPVRLLKQLGRLPHEFGTWLGVGHTIPNSDPPEPYVPGTELCGAIVLSQLLAPDAFNVLERPGEAPIEFLAVVPLHAGEMDFKLQHGAPALLDGWEAAGMAVTELVDPARPALVAPRRKKRFGIF